MYFINLSNNKYLYYTTIYSLIYLNFKILKVYININLISNFTKTFIFLPIFQ